MKNLMIRGCSEADAILRLKVAVAQAGSTREFAARHGMAHSFIANVLRGTQPISPRLAATIGLEPVTVYRRKNTP